MIFENTDYDVSNVDYSRKRKVLTMVTWTGAKSERHFLDKETEAMYGKLVPKFAGLRSAGSMARTTARPTSWCGSAVTACPASTTPTMPQRQAGANWPPPVRGSNEKDMAEMKPDHVHEPRWPDHPRLPDAARWRGAEEPARGGEPARRSMGT